MTEGVPLRWRFSQAGASGIDTLVPLMAVPPAGAELATDDVSASWPQQWVGDLPSPPVALSALHVFAVAVIPVGATSADFEVPTVVDGVHEGTESVTWQVHPSFEGGSVPGLPAGTTFTGTVADPS